MFESLDATYPYSTATGVPLFEVRRFSPKRFELRDEHGELLEQFPQECVLYRLPELCQADPGQTVYVCEGEKDVDNLRQHGLIATTNPGGTRRGWRPDYTDCLRGRHVVILPDADGPGQKHATAVAAAVTTATRSTVILMLPNLRGRDDVSDWLARGNKIEKLVDLTARRRFKRAGLNGPPRRVSEKMELIFAAEIAPTCKLSLLTMLHRSRHDDIRHPGVVELTAAALAGMTGIHRVTAQQTMALLRNEGVLRRVGRSGHVIVWDILAVICPARAAQYG